MSDLSNAEIGKYLAAKRAMAFVKPDMKIGLGTGSTAAWFVKILARAQNEGLRFKAAATSLETTKLAESLGIKIHPLDELGQLDVAIDGADEFDPDLNLIKGGGGALLIEKIVERATDQLVIITDASKEVDVLGQFPLPVEVVKYGWQTTQRMMRQILDDLGQTDYRIERRASQGGEGAFVSDEGHYILDIHLGAIKDAGALSSRFLDLPGVVETGLFLNMTDAIIMASHDGTTRIKMQGADWAQEQVDMAAEADLIAQVAGMK